MSNSLQPHGLQYPQLPCPSPTPRAYSNSCPLIRWCHPTISPLSSPSPPAFNLSQHRGLFKWVSSSHRVAKVLAFQLQHQAFQWIFVFNKNLLVPLLWNVQKHKKLIELLPDSTKNAGALGRPRGMEWGGRREEGSGWGTHVYLWRINFDIWQI